MTDEILSDKQKDIIVRVFDIVLERALKDIYYKMDAQTQKKMDKVFSSGSEKAKENFSKEKMANLEEIFLQELEKIEREIESDINK